jgi:hypothetical protein
MKSWKSFSYAAAACFLAGAPGIAMAQEINTCEDGSIFFASVDEVVVEGRSCAITESFVSGSITATGGSTISVTASRVGGDIKISGAGNAFVTGNQVFNGEIRLLDNEDARVTANVVGESIVANRNERVEIKGNVVTKKLRCQDNDTLIPGVNIVGGADECLL